jgi:DNA-binding transcriptional regulator YiaG
MTDRVFPKACGNCRQHSMALAIIPYDIDVTHDGRTYHVHIPLLTVPRCRACGRIVIDDEAGDIIQVAFRKEARLLSPKEIRQGRLAIGYTNQQEFANCLNVAVATVSRWENGVQVQQRFHDGVLRAFFSVPDFRQFMEELNGVKRPSDEFTLAATGRAKP